MTKKTRKKKAVIRNCYIGARFTEAERDAFHKRHKIKGREASKLIRMLLLNGSIETDPKK